MLLTRSPLINQASLVFSFDLHVLSTPPAFVLSQDQTLQTKPTNPNQPHTTKHEAKPEQQSEQQSRKPDQAQPNPTTKKQDQANQNKTSPKKPHTTMRSPKGPWHKKHDTLSSSQTTHPQEKPTNQTSSQAFLKAPEKLTLKVFISQVPDQ